MGNPENMMNSDHKATNKVYRDNYDKIFNKGIKKMSIKEYDNLLEVLNKTFDEFNKLAEEGKDGYGSKKKALEARKLSLVLQDRLKTFRKLSIKNDKEK